MNIAMELGTSKAMIILVIIFVIIAPSSMVHADVPDTIAMCLGKDSCARCVAVRTTMMGEISHFKVLPAKPTCIQELAKAGGGYRAEIDEQLFAYGPREALTDPQTIASLSYRYSPSISSGLESGAAAAVLSSMMRQDVLAEQAEEVNQRLNNIRRAINTITTRLTDSYRETQANLHSLDQDTQRRFQGEIANAQVAIGSRDKELLAIQNAKLPIFPQRATTDPSFGTGGLAEEVIRDEIRRTIPPQNYRAHGNDLGGVLRRSVNESTDQRSELDSEIHQEREKLSAALQAGRISPLLKQKFDEELSAIQRLTLNGDAKGIAIAKRAFNDTRSARQTAEGKSTHREETVLKEDGTLTTRLIPADKPPEKTALPPVIARLSYSITTATKSVNKAEEESSAYHGDDRIARQNVASLARKIIEGSVLAFYGGNLIEADTLVNVGLILADIATSWIPQLSVPRSVYELITGRDLFTSQELTDLELTGRVLDIVTVGLGSKFVKGYENVLRISKIDPALGTERFKKIVSAAERFAEKALKKDISPTIRMERLKHIAERHLPGGIEVGGEGLNTVFKNADEVLDLAIEAVKHPNAEVHATNNATRYLWRRGKDATIIGFDPKDPSKVCRDVAVVIEEKTKSIITTYPWHPDNDLLRP